LGICFIALLSFSASAESIWVEAETYTASHDAGGLAIYVTGCTGASGGLAVEGFDYPGDWIELKLTVAENGAFVDSLRSGGVLAVESDLRCTVASAGPGGEDIVSVYNTLGYGVG
jgi:hypothetical protein